MDTALEQLGGELGEPALDLVQPRRAGRDEVQVEPRVGGQPALDGVGLVGGVVVADQVHLEILGDFLVQLGEEAAELHRAVPTVQRPDHLPARDIEGGKEAGDPVVDVVVGAALGVPGSSGNTGWDRSSAWT